MEKLSYEDYRKCGGNQDHNAFLLLLTDCEAELERQTFGRIDKLDDKIKRCMTVLIDTVFVKDDKRGLTSYSNPIESFGFADGSVEGRARTIRDICKTYLPSNLLYRGVKK